jgi:hypothetical protein
MREYHETVNWGNVDNTGTRLSHGIRITNRLTEYYEEKYVQREENCVSAFGTKSLKAKIISQL